MSNDVAIRVENLSKLYRIGRAQEQHDTLRDALVSAVRAPLERLRRGSASSNPDSEDTIWALKDVSFEVKRGEVVGVIGRNGAGKSTLLKILSRITEPTSGRAVINGRVGSLLEVGTGFHPELTGRENVYLSGAILGMRREEIDRKFDEIVDFSGVEKFIDTPFKRYSSGMRVRLGFAVAAHLDPEILLVDEVLAVGDAEFQKKCLGKMGEVAGAGRTVVFVSHQLAMVNTLCRRVILLADGEIMLDGYSDRVIDEYMGSILDSSITCTEVEFQKDTAKSAQITKIRIVKADSNTVKLPIDVFDKLELVIHYYIHCPVQGMAVVLSVKRNGEKLFASFDTDANPRLLDSRAVGSYRTVFKMPSPLKSGRYTLTINIGRLNIGGAVDVHPDVLSFDVEEVSIDTSMRSYSSKRPGVIAVHKSWDTRRISD